MAKKWVYKTLPNQEESQRLASSINVSLPVAIMLKQRGVHSFDEAKIFFRPSLENLHNPFLMKDMDKAVWRLEEAIRNREKILIYGDYDVDGTTAVASFYGFLRQFYTSILYYTPDRYTEGYGVSIKGMDWAKSQGVSLVICLDCGIKSHDAIHYAQELDIDFIVCDHHLPANNLPEAFAVLDPKRADCSYPFKELSGCGVGFKLLQAFCQNNNIPFDKLYPFLDLLAVSIAADIVPIIDENRIFTHFGLQLLSYRPRFGLKALMDIASLKKPIDVSSIVFGIAPRLNAGGRIAHAGESIRLLLADNEGEATKLAQTANTSNETRRNFDTNITQEAILLIEKDFNPNMRTTVLFKPDWHKGVVGIVAARCIEKFYRPTIILTQSDGKATGSARSVNGFDIHHALEECADLLDQYGGHAHAAGLSLELENLPAFKHKFESVVAKKIEEEHLTPSQEIDCVIELKQINANFFKILKQMSPFGPHNMQPVFVSKSVKLHGTPMILKDSHIKFFIKQEDSPLVEAIGFGMAYFQEFLSQDRVFDICYTISENEYKGRRNFQLMIKDIH
jgi:single-stranded-DNA-specific exonuclease